MSTSKQQGIPGPAGDARELATWVAPDVAFPDDQHGNQVLVAIGNFLFRFRNGLFPLSLLFVLLPGRALFADPLVAVAFGFGIALSGQLLRAFTIGIVYVVRGGRNRRVYAKGLVTKGFYRLCRNPLYVGNLLIIAGLAVASNSLACLLVTIPVYLFVYVAIVAAEEAFLRSKFGAAYDRYVADVPRWLPRLTALGKALRDDRYHWRRLAAKEPDTPFGWITVLMLVSFWHLASQHTLAARHGVAHALTIGYAVLVVAFVILRLLKLSRRIVTD
jgi:protein-S-isoprenylcysteine O-methyltransferase Ste14